MLITWLLHARTHARALLRVAVGCAKGGLGLLCGTVGLGCFLRLLVSCLSLFVSVGQGGCVTVGHGYFLPLLVSVCLCLSLFVSVGQGGFGAWQAGNWRHGDYLVGVG